MDILIKSARITDPNSEHKGQVVDVLVKDGKIAEIGNDLTAEGAERIEGENLHLSPGWFDLRANFQDPGFEYKEDIHSGIQAAARGGFTGVAVLPGTEPPLSTKTDIEYVRNKARGAIVDVHPMGTLSRNREGKEMSEMYDMQQAGAVAFTDDKQAVSNPSLMCRALLYTRNFDGLAISFPQDEKMSAGGKMNEGETSTVLGLHGIPALAEELQVGRDIQLASYAGARLHFAPISSAGSVELIRRAKADGLAITAEVAAHQLLLDDSVLSGYDTNYKVMPPLRTKDDISALVAGLKDGTIDVISSDHTPEDIESKAVEFDQAAFGISSLETAYSSANTALKGLLSEDELVTNMAIRPREILRIPVPSIKVGEAANLTIFDPKAVWQPDGKTFASKSTNSPFIGKELTGKVIAVCNHDQLVRCN